MDTLFLGAESCHGRVPRTPPQAPPERLLLALLRLPQELLGPQGRDRIEECSEILIFSNLFDGEVESFITRSLQPALELLQEALRRRRLRRPRP